MKVLEEIDTATQEKKMKCGKKCLFIVLKDITGREFCLLPIRYIKEKSLDVVIVITDFMLDRFNWKNIS